MNRFVAAFQFFLRKLFSFLNIPAIIYDTMITRSVTTHMYQDFYTAAKKKIHSSANILDVGVGTGYALESIIDRIPESTKVFGIDIDPFYVQSAQKRFKNRKNVNIQLQNFYEMKATNQKFDIIIFSMSIMLMPDQAKAIELAKTLLNENGRIYFLLTLNNKRNRLMEKIKPAIKYMTTIDFGKVTYENDFDNLRSNCGLVTLNKQRVNTSINVFLKAFRIFTIETIPKEFQETQVVM